jgi:hypothetical protein
MSASSPIAFSAVALSIVRVLAPHTPFAEAIVRRQAERLGISPEAVSPADLPRLVPLVIAASQAFVDPVVIEALKTLR